MCSPDETALSDQPPPDGSPANQLARLAWEAMLSTDERLQAGNRPDQAQRIALLAAESLRRGNAGANQGRDCVAARQYQAVRERRILQEAEAGWKPEPARLVGHRGEHSVYIDEAHERVTKITHGGRYGYTVDQGPDADARRLTLRDALPSEYLSRQGLMCVVFGDAVHLRAVIADRYYPGSPALVVEQRYVKGVHDADDTEISAFMKAAGFRRLEERLFDKEVLPDGLWYREADHLLVGDANPSNFVRLHDSRQLIPIDLLLTPYPPSCLADIKRRLATADDD